MQLSCYMLNKGDIPTGESRKYLQKEVGKKSSKKQITLWKPYSLSCVVKIRVNPFSSANLSRWRQRRRPFFKNTDDEQYTWVDRGGLLALPAMNDYCFDSWLENKLFL